MKGQNDNLLQNIQDHWSINVNEDIQLHYVKNTFRIEFYCYVGYIFKTHSLIHFKLIYNRVMTNKILFKMNLADSSTCLFCNGEETVVHAFLECENLIECWIRRVIDRQFKLSDVDNL